MLPLGNDSEKGKGMMSPSFKTFMLAFVIISSIAFNDCRATGMQHEPQHAVDFDPKTQKEILRYKTMIGDLDRLMAQFPADVASKEQVIFSLIKKAKEQSQKYLNDLEKEANSSLMKKQKNKKA